MPADRAEFHRKADSIACDEIILDLEDSVPASHKLSARHVMRETLRTIPFDGKVVAVRVNSVTSEWFEEDLAAAAQSSRVDSLIIPKVGSGDDIRSVDAALATLGRRLSLEPQVETARGVEHASDIASASESVCTLHFGPFDFAASVGAPTSGAQIAPELHLHGLIRTLVAGKASALQVVDGPFADMRDQEGLRQAAQLAARLGCDGKWAIHPDQLAIINAAFAPTPQQLARAKAILDAYAASTDAGVGAVRLNDEMLDEATRRWALETLARAGSDT